MLRTAYPILHAQRNQPLQPTPPPSQAQNKLGFVEEGMEELLAQAETELKEQHKDLLAVLGAIADDEVDEYFSVVQALQPADVVDLALVVALLPRPDKVTFLYYLNDLNTYQQVVKYSKIRSEAELWYPGG